jgi:histidyl-tRNA synthetase
MLIQAPRGTKDLLPDDFKYYKFIENTIDAQAEINGFERIETPAFEYESIFLKSLGDTSDIVEKEMYEVKRFSNQGSKDNDEKEKLVLRPEGTASIVRAYIEHGMKTWTQPVQLYYFSPMFRYDRPQKGRMRQFWQFGFEQIGSSDPGSDARMISLAHSICKALRLDDAIILVNSLGCKNCRPNLKVFIKEFFEKKKVGLCKDCQKRLTKNPFRILDCKEKSCQKIAKTMPPIVDRLCEECKDHFKQVLEFLDEAEVSYDLDPRLVRGLDYYTRTIFEVVEKGDTSRQNTLMGGGRYDNLIEAYGEKSTPAIGFASGVERIIEVLKKKNIKIEDAEKPQVFIAQLGEKAKRKAITLLELLQNEGIRSKAALSKNNLKSQLHIADKFGVSQTIIIGQREVMDGTAIIRDMKEGIQEVVEQEELLDRLKRKLDLK